MPRSKFAKRKIIIDKDRPCPLLQKLPLELRMTIWRLVLADRIIHVQGQTSCPLFRNVREQHELSKVLVSSKAIDEHPGFVEYIKRHSQWSSMTSNQKDSVRDRWRNEMLAHGRTCQLLPHYDCSTDRWVSPDQDVREPKLVLNLLRTCRKVYLEAHDIFWKYNTFSFEGCATWFHDWVANRTARQKKMIASIHLAYSEWWLIKRFRREIVAELTNLREIYFLVYFRAPFCGSDGSITISYEWGSLNPFFMWFQCLNLRRAGVVVSIDTHMLEEHNTYKASRFTLRQAVDLAEEIRWKILPPPTEGEEIQAQKTTQKAKKASSKRKTVIDATDVEAVDPGIDGPSTSQTTSLSLRTHEAERQRKRRIAPL